jgi:FtsP/CotA-like multicopper oxidase with cupredoxin domain
VATSTQSESATVGFSSQSLFRWYLNSTTMVVDWQEPTLLQILKGNTTFETLNAVIELPNANEWVNIVIETTLGVPHPIHLHGHDFFVLAQGTGTYSSNVALTLSNPPRRDTAMLPASGYLVIAFETDNPGAWLMHCHIGMYTHEFV